MDGPAGEAGFAGILDAVAVEVVVLVAGERGLLVVQEVVAGGVVLARGEGLGRRAGGLVPAGRDVLAGRVVARGEAGEAVGAVDVGGGRDAGVDAVLEEMDGPAGEAGFAGILDAVAVE